MITTAVKDERLYVTAIKLVSDSKFDVDILSVGPA